jgi:hypothetical protein
MAFRKGILMTSQISDRLARFGRVLNIVAKVLVVLCIISAVFALFAAIAVAAIPEGLIVSALGDIHITSDLFNFAASAQLGDYLLPSAIGGAKIVAIFALARVCVYCILSAIILFILSAFFRATAVQKTPFLEENVRRLKIIGVILIVASLVLGLNNLIIAFAVLALAYVFQYGAELQRSADETL